MKQNRPLPMSGKVGKVKTRSPLREASGNYAKCQVRTKNRTQKSFYQKKKSDKSDKSDKSIDLMNYKIYFKIIQKSNPDFL